MGERQEARQPRLFWRWWRCEVCGRLFELLLDNPTLPLHTPRRRDADGAACPGREGVPT